MDKFIREPEVLNLVGFSRSTLWRRETAGDFPKRRQISSRSVGWILSEVLHWIASRPLAEGKIRTAASKDQTEHQKTTQPSISPKEQPAEDC